MRVKKLIHPVEYTKLALLFFMQGAAGASWWVSLTSVLDAHGLRSIKPLAYATMALAALVSPLIFGALADRHVPPVRVLRFIATGSAIMVFMSSFAILEGWGAWAVLGFIQLFSLFAVPATSISTTIILERLENAPRQFGPIRAMFTIGWIAGCFLVSVLNADTSSMAGFSCSAIWLTVAALTFFLPSVEKTRSNGALKWHERLGLDALVLLKNADCRVVFITILLLSIPVSAFYPYTPIHLRALGFEHTSAWMSIGQFSEIVAMFCLGSLLVRWRLKWIILAGLFFGFCRFGLCMLNGKAWVLTGVSLHGLTYTLVFVTGQIYLDQRVDHEWRARAQALMSLIHSGIGALIGYLGTGAWFNACTNPEGTRWPVFWGGITAVTGGVMVYFFAAYHGRADAHGFTKRSSVSVAANALEHEVGEG